jgi:tRNA nucleotidyltransferase/poly(A) polymerase
MAEMLRDVAKQDWFRAAPVQMVFSVLGKNDAPARIVGGAVRDALAGLPIGDIDFATPLPPDQVVERLAAAGLKAVPTGIEHGTVTAVVAGTGYQVTTLREDVETDGRRAVVRFGHDWVADARRRDFTVNALSVDSSGQVHDPLGGYGDIVSRSIRFIGDADQRIAEDRLRVLRFFRFNAEFGQGDIDTIGLGAAIRARNDLRSLSAERIGQEMQRLVVASRAAEIAGSMQDAGILGAVLGGVGYIGTLQRVAAFAPESDIAVRLTALGCRVESDVERLTERMRLANAVRDRMLALLMAARSLPPVLTERDARRGLYSSGVSVWPAAVSLGFAWRSGTADMSDWRAFYSLPDRWSPPRFPLTGRDVARAGMARGPAIGDVLRSIESWWVEQDFAPSEGVLHARLQQIVSSAQ